jgi:hypothetical protein
MTGDGSANTAYRCAYALDGGLIEAGGYHV